MARQRAGVLVSPNPALLTWPRPTSAPSGGGDPLNPTYITQAVSASGTTTYTWTGVSIGAESSTRTVLVVFNARISFTVTTATTITATIGGTLATVDYYKHVLGAEQGNNPTGVVGFIRLPVASGTTATISVTVSAACLRAGISVYTFDGPATLVDSGWDYGVSGPDPASVGPLSTVAGGALIAGGNHLNATATLTPTSDHETLIASSYYHSTAGVGTTGADVTAGYTGNEFAVLGAVTYQPA